LQEPQLDLLNLPEQSLHFLPQPNHQQDAGETLQPSGSALRYERRQRELKFFSLTK
jgi:hypothetical protein